MRAASDRLFVGAVLAALVLIALAFGGGGLAVVGDEKADQRLAPDRISLTGAAARLNAEPDIGRFALHTALAEEVPGAAFIVVSPDDPVDLGQLLRIARGSSVRLAPEEAREPLHRAVSALIEERAFIGLAARSGSVRSSGEWWAWELHLLDGDAQELFIHAPGGLLVATDARLLPPDVRDLFSASDGGGRVRTLTPVTAGLVEASLLLGILLLGGFLLPRDLIGHPARFPTALVVGLAVLSVAGAFARGVLLVVAPLLITVAVGTVLTRCGHRPGWRRSDLIGLLGSGLVLAGIAVAVRVFGLVHVSTDTISYLDAAASLAASGPAFGLPSGRSPSLVAIHALGSMAGVDGMFSLGPAVMLAGVLLLLGAALRGPRDAPTIVIALVAVLLLSASSFVRLLTMLVNSHAYVAVLLLLLAVLWRRTLAHPSGQAGAGPVAGLLAAAIALGRPEGPVIVLLFLAGTTVVDRRTGWREVWYWVGAVTLVRPAVGLLDGSVRIGTSDLVLLVLGLGALSAPSVADRLPGRPRQALPAALVGVLWAVLLVSSSWGPMPDLLDNTRDNLLTGAGGWGLTVPTLLVLLVLTAALSRSRRSPEGRAALAPLATCVAGFVPAMLLVRAFGSEAGGRVHWHDSNNRMWLHLVPILLLLVVETVRARSDAHRDDAGSTVGSARRLSAAAAVIALALPAFAWQPAFSRESLRQTELLAEPPESLWKGDGIGGEAGSIGPALVGLETVLATVPLGLGALSAADRTRPGEVCIGVRLGTFGRPLSGGVEIAVVTGRLESSGVVDVQDLEDLDRAVVCLGLEEQQGGVGQLGDDAVVTIRGQGTLAGAAPAVMLDEAGSPVLSVELSWTDPPRGDEPLVRTVPQIALGMVAVLALLMLLAPPRSRLRDPVRP